MDTIVVGNPTQLVYLACEGKVNVKNFVAVEGSKSANILPLSHWKVVQEMRSATLWMEGWR